MGSETLLDGRGRFALLRYVSDLARDEARNVGVVLFTDDGFCGMRAVPPSGLTPRLREQGLLDRLLVSIAKSIDRQPSPDLSDLQRWHNSWSHSLQLSEPRPTAVQGAPLNTLNTLYRALVAQQPRRSRVLGKSEVLDRVVNSFRQRGASVRRSGYIQDYLFDAIVETEGSRPTAVSALSFASGAKEWTSVEKDAGHFLFAMTKVSAGHVCVVQPPVDAEANEAKRSCERVRRWFEAESVRTVELSEVDSLAVSLIPTTPDGTRTAVMGLFAAE